MTKKINSRIVTTFVALTVSVGLSISQGHARTLNYASPYPSGSTPTDAIEAWAQKVKEYSGEDLSVRVFPLSLLSASESSAGIRDGITDVGYVVGAYWPGDYAHVNLVNETAMQLQLFDSDVLNGKSTFAFQGAMADFIFNKCPECIDEFSAQNQVYTTNSTTTSYVLICNSPVVSLSDMKGLRVRAGGSHWSRWLSHFEASQMNLTINEIREALSQGVVDCTASQISELDNLGLGEVVGHVTVDVPSGVYAGVSGATFNADVWKSLTKSDRRAALRAAPHLMAHIAWESEAQDSGILEAWQSKGGQVHNVSEDFLKATKEFVRNDMESLIVYYKDRHNVVRAQEMFDEFNLILNKWVGLVQEVKSMDDLSELYWNEIFSKVDVDNYGM